MQLGKTRGLALQGTPARGKSGVAAGGRANSTETSPRCAGTRLVEGLSPFWGVTVLKFPTSLRFVPLRFVSGGHRTAKANRLSGALLLLFCGLLAFPAALEAAPYSALVIDANTGKVLHARNADSRRYPASLTKIMTLYVLFDFLKDKKVGLNSRFTVSAHAAAQAPSKIGVKPGDTIMVIDAIRALVTKSANDVAVVVAENLGGSEENFARMMTATARGIGMTQTTFRNASGLPDDEQVTTARDMATLGRRMMRDYPNYYDFFATKYFSYGGNRYRNHNKLLFNYQGTDGIKTGYTRGSGFNLVASVQRNDKHLIGVVMGGRTGAKRDAQMRRLLDRAFPQAVASRSIPTVPVPLRNPRTEPEQAVAVANTAAVPSFVPFQQKPEPEATAPQQIEEGDTEATSSAGLPPFYVQVGAYASQADADRRLTEVGAKAASLLQGRQPLTLSFSDGGRPLYRARFAGFTESDAREACAQLKRLDIVCIVMRAD